jgi:hypothetical protein
MRSEGVLQVRLLEGAAAECHGEQLSLPPRGPAAGFLAVRPGLNDRETAAALLWPGSAGTAARANLRTAVWALHKAAGNDALMASRTAAGLRPEAATVDLTDCRRCGAAAAWGASRESPGGRRACSGGARGPRSASRPYQAVPTTLPAGQAAGQVPAGSLAGGQSPRSARDSAAPGVDHTPALSRSATADEHSSRSLSVRSRSTTVRCLARAARYRGEVAAARRRPTGSRPRC